MRRKCTTPGCDHFHVARGLCNMHYKRVKRHGSSGPTYEPRDNEIPPVCICIVAVAEETGECRLCGRPNKAAFADLRLAWRRYYVQKGWDTTVDTV
jgi:hypothetical protein